DLAQRNPRFNLHSQPLSRQSTGPRFLADFAKRFEYCRVQRRPRFRIAEQLSVAIRLSAGPLERTRVAQSCPTMPELVLDDDEPRALRDLLTGSPADVSQVLFVLRQNLGRNAPHDPNDSVRPCRGFRVNDPHPDDLTGT